MNKKLTLQSRGSVHENHQGSCDLVHTHIQGFGSGSGTLTGPQDLGSGEMTFFIFSNGQETKSLGRSSAISSDKTMEKQIRGRNAPGYQNSGML